MSLDYVDSESNNKSKKFIISTLTWLVISLVLSIWIAKDSIVLDSFFEKFKFVLSCLFFCTLFAQIGNALRVFAHPDGILVTGGFWDIVWKKIFWRIGPQSIGFLFAFFWVIQVYFPTEKKENSFNNQSSVSVHNQDNRQVGNESYPSINAEQSSPKYNKNIANQSANDLNHQSIKTNCPKDVNDIVCTNKSLMALHNKYISTITKANSINNSETGWIVSEFNNEIGKCGNDFTCISGAYINAINSANRITPESR